MISNEEKVYLVVVGIFVILLCIEFGGHLT